MLVVLDTNVLVSGLLNPKGPPGKILDLVISQNYLGELPDTGIYAIHYLAGFYFLLEHSPAPLYPLLRFRSQPDFFIISGN